MSTHESKPRERRETYIQVRCTPSYKAWIERFAKAERSTPSQLIDQGLVMLAATKKCDPPPPR